MGKPFESQDWTLKQIVDALIPVAGWLKYGGECLDVHGLDDDSYEAAQKAVVTMRFNYLEYQSRRAMLERCIFELLPHAGLEPVPFVFQYRDFVPLHQPHDGTEH